MNNYISAITAWRHTWKTKSKYLAVVGCRSEKDTISKAIDKAHQPSVGRALKCNGISTEIPRQKAKDYLICEITNKLNKQSFTFDEYNEWAKVVCYKIREIYRDSGISDYTVGNAQKLFNMAIKFVLSADNIDPSLPIFKVAHIPVDRVIMDIAKKKLGVKRMKQSWSKTDDFEEILGFEKRLKDALPDGYYSPMHWECENWKS